MAGLAAAQMSGGSELQTTSNRPDIYRRPCVEVADSIQCQWKCRPPSHGRPCHCTSSLCRRSCTRLQRHQTQFTWLASRLSYCFPDFVCRFQVFVVVLFILFVWKTICQLLIHV